SKVAWEVICLPKAEGGLCIKRLGVFNNALLSSHIWKLLTRKESLWVQWIHTYKLKDQNFWDIPCRGNKTWRWRKILQLRPLIREFCCFKIGDGSCTSIWFDNWCSLSPLASIISSRDIYRAGLTSNSKVSDLLLEGTLVWPPDLIARYHTLLSVTSPSMDRVKIMAGLSNSSPSNDSIVSDILPFANRRTTRSVIAKLVVAATAYFIWQERNYCLFKKVKRSENQLVECIISSVRFKLMTCRFKK
nr:hypothetical protein [Tanacetum cinerariifolium]